MRVFDAHVHIGCQHLPPVKVYHQLTLTGIAGATLLADPENIDLPCGYPCASEVADRWRHLRHLTTRGNLRSQKRSHPWLLAIPATPFHDGCVSRSRRFSPYDDLRPRYELSLLADGNECLTQGLRKRICLSLHPEVVTGVHPCVPTRLLSIPTLTRHASRMVSNRESSGVLGLGSRRVVPTGRLAIRGVVRRVCSRQVLPRTCGGALRWRDVSQLLQQSEVTQRR
jgi:hypothetical protein